MRQPRMGKDVLRLQGRDEVLQQGGWGCNGGEEKCSVPNVKKKKQKEKKKSRMSRENWSREKA